MSDSMTNRQVSRENGSDSLHWLGECEESQLAKQVIHGNGHAAPLAGWQVVGATMRLPSQLDR